MEVGSAVARTSSRAARPCAADAAPLRYPHVREEASRSGLLGPRRRPRAWARRRGGTVARSAIVHGGVTVQVDSSVNSKRARVFRLPLPLFISPLRWATLGPTLGAPFWAEKAH